MRVYSPKMGYNAFFHKLSFFVIFLSMVSCSTDEDMVFGIGERYNKIKVIHKGEERLFRYGDNIYWAFKLPQDTSISNIAVRLDKRSLGWINIENKTYPVDSEVFIASGVYKGLSSGKYRVIIRVRDKFYGPFFFTIYSEER
jgi:hypothetical protein